MHMLKVNNRHNYQQFEVQEKGRDEQQADKVKTIELSDLIRSSFTVNMEAAEGDKMKVREARIRRILETGSDRMALITGRIQSVPYSPRSPSLRRTLAESSSFSDRISSNSITSGQIDAGSKTDKNDKSFNDSEQEDTMEQKNSFDEQAGTEKKMEVEDTTKEIKCTAEHTMKEKNEIDQEDTNVKCLKQNNESSQVLPEDGTIVSEDGVSRSSWTNAITPKLITFCIMSSEPARSVCSLVVALLVVSSQMNLLKYGCLSAWSPLYILLIANISIVVALLHVEREKGELEEEESPVEDSRSWGGAVKVLETGLVVYHSVRALFIDFSIYSVVVVCGLSFA